MSKKELLATMTNGIRSLKGRMEELGKNEINKAAFLTTACMALSKDEKLLNCSVLSIQTAVMQAANDGLMLDGNEAALIAFKETCTYMPMVQGIVKKARMHGDLKDINTMIVYANDEFSWSEGDNPHIDHFPKLQDRGEIIGGYVIVTLNDGSKKRLVMAKDDIEKIRQTSKFPNGVWAKFWEPMAKKTLMRQISKQLNLSPDVQRVIKDVDQYYDMEVAKERKAPIEVPNPALAALREEIPEESANG